MNTTKQCCECRKKIPVDAFGKDTRRKDGLKSTCRKCISTAAKKFYTRNMPWSESREEEIFKKADVFLYRTYNRRISAGCGNRNLQGS